jgi:methyl coenzyme M reductase alpha subunit
MPKPMCLRCGVKPADWFCPDCNRKWEAERADEMRDAFVMQAGQVLNAYVSAELVTEIANQLYEVIQMPSRLCDNCETDYYNFKAEMQYDDFAATARYVA